MYYALIVLFAAACLILGWLAVMERIERRRLGQEWNGDEPEF